MAMLSQLDSMMYVIGGNRCVSDFVNILHNRFIHSVYWCDNAGLHFVF